MLILVACLLNTCACLLAGAEEDTKTLNLDRSRIRWAMAMTAGMAANALELPERAAASYQRFVLKRFSELRWAEPDKAIVLEFDITQANAAMRAIGIETFSWEKPSSSFPSTQE